MKQLLEYIIPNIVNHPEEVEITETQDNGTVNLTIKVNAEDTGRVIGKAGKVIKAIRQIVRIMAIKQGVRVNVDVLDGQGAPAAQEATSETSEETPAAETAQEPQEVQEETPAETTEETPQASETE